MNQKTFWANLSGANLFRANLSGANVSGPNISSLTSKGQTLRATSQSQPLRATSQSQPLRATSKGQPLRTNLSEPTSKDQPGKLADISSFLWMKVTCKIFLPLQFNFIILIV